MHFVGP